MYRLKRYLKFYFVECYAFEYAEYAFVDNCHLILLMKRVPSLFFFIATTSPFAWSSRRRALMNSSSLAINLEISAVNNCCGKL